MVQFGGKASAKKVPPPKSLIKPRWRRPRACLVQSAALAEPLAPIDRTGGIGLAPQPAAVTVVIPIIEVKWQPAENKPGSTAVIISTPNNPVTVVDGAIDALFDCHGSVHIRNPNPDVDVALSRAVDCPLAATIAATSRAVDRALAATTAAAADCALTTAATATDRALTTATTATATCFLTATATATAGILCHRRDRKKCRSKGCSDQCFSYSCHGTLRFHFVVR